jgi:hypothetical protein
MNKILNMLLMWEIGGPSRTQEVGDGELPAEVEVFAAEHLFTCASADFSLEVKYHAKASQPLPHW